MNNQLKARIFTFFVIFSMLLGALGMPNISVRAASIITFTAEEILGKPEDTSITINIVPATTIEYHYQYGTTSGGPYTNTPNYTATGSQPSEVTITGLTANTQYYYQMQYHAPGDPMDDWVTRSEHSFWTQRAQGSSFTFTVTSDSHAQMNTAHQQAMTNINNEHPDFNIDLGDTFYVDGATSQGTVNTKYLAYRAPSYMGKIGPSVPIFLASGNHEDEEGWNLDDTPFSIALGSVLARKLYFPTPIQDGFYSGNTDILAAISAATYGDQYREDYYAWTWGDALFVVIDEFQYTMNLPYAPGAAGEGTDDSQTGDQWSWTLGAQQFQWFKQTLENSDAKYKFVFSHQMLGGIPNLTIAGVGPGYVRGGGGAAAYFEWGGKNSDGTAGFATHRNAADFGTEPIHQLMIDNGVSAYFHGHDHQYVYETCDGIVYQEVPSPSMAGSGFGGIYTEGDHGTYNTIKILPSTGHLRITVNPTQATVDYISSTTTTPTVNYSYTIAPNPSGPTHTLTTAVSPSGGGTINPAIGTHTYNEGDVVTVTATSNTGYTFSSWSGACTGSGACSVTMDADKTVIANFTINTYTLTYSATTGGAITAPATSPTTHDYGTVVPITAAPNPGYHFVNWTGDVSTVANVNLVSTTITMNGNCAITANFALDIVTYTLTAGNDGHGSVTLNPAGGTYASGTTVTLTPVPSSGYQFIAWSGTNSGDIIDTSGVYTIVMNGNKTVQANFTQITYTLTAGNDDHGSVTLNPAGGIYASGMTVTLTPVPSGGYQFISWSGTNAGDIIDSSGVYTIVMNGNKSVIANFIQITYTLTVSNDGHGSVALNPASGTYAPGTTVTLTPLPSGGYQFISWSGTNAGDIIYSSGVYTIVMNGNKSVKANFFINTYSLTYNAGTGGTITSPATSPTTHNPGALVTITAVPNTGYHFVNWTGDVSTVADVNAASTTITMNGNYAIAAHFAIYTYYIFLPITLR